MQKIASLLSIAICFSFSIKAQTGKITGSVKDGSSKAVRSATVSLFKLNDSSLVKFVATNKDGEFEISGINDGNYFVSASNVSYGIISSAAFEISSLNSLIRLPVLILSDHQMVDNKSVYKHL
jgi:hypothetical protein